MKQTFNLTLFGTWAMVLASCGTSARVDGKTGAAQALLSASTLTHGVELSRDLGFPGKIRSVDCPLEGSATLSDFSFSEEGVSDSAGETQFVVTYRTCGIKTDNGTARFDGALTFNQSATVAPLGSTISQRMKGKITISGAVDDFLDADILQVVDVSSLDAKGEAVTVILQGALTTTEGAKTYDESLVIAMGSIKVLTVSKK
jgi:hypothetical protein